MKMTRLRGSGFLAALVATALVLAGCGSDDESGSSTPKDETAPLTDTVKVTYLYTPSLTSGPAFVAKAMGYFEDEHLDVTLEPFTGSSASALPLLATGKADAIGTSASPGFFNGIVNDVDVKFVLSGGSPVPGAPTSQFLALADGPIKSIEDLKGQKVALNGGAETVSGYYLNELLKQGGLSIDDVEVVNLDFEAGLAAVDNGAVAATLVQAPTWQALTEDGSHIALGDMDPVYANGQASGVIFGSNLLKKDRQAGVALARALLRAASTDLQGDYLSNDKVVAALAEGLGSTVDDVKRLTPPVFNPELTLNPEVFQAAQKFWSGIGALTYSDPLTNDQVIDKEIVDEALSSASKAP